MKRYIEIIVVLFFCWNISLHGQTKISNLNAFEKVDQETLFVHFNTSVMLVGERLFYKVYCLNSRTNKLSNLSKIAYVELLDNKSEVIFKHKIRLDFGTGAGDFFIPASILSGGYKLIAYTQWMRNGGENNFFQNDICIINPFNEIKNEITSNINFTDTIQEFQVKDLLVDKDIARNNNKEVIQLKLDENEFGKREKISLTIRSLKDIESYGNYSISVRKIDGLKEPKKSTSSNFKSLFYKSNNTINSGSIFLPEYRGELLTGKVIFKNSNKIASNVKVGLSIPGKNYIFKIANTNNLGEFFFHIAEEYNNSEAIIELINSGGENAEIILYNQEPFNFKNLNFSNFWISTNLNDVILKHSINNQIENAYATVKKDTVKDSKVAARFFGEDLKEYFLDDYTRFPTIRETFIEIVDLVYTTKKNGGSILNVAGIKTSYDSGYLPLVLLDGIVIKDIDEFLRFNTDKVKKISVLAKKYVYGSQLFEGIISVETNKGDFQNSNLDNTIKKIVLFKPLPAKNYFNQMYDGSKNLERIPDFRCQLLWLPNLVLDAKDKEITFYTSDNVGDYVISLEGFTNEGIPVSLKELFSVKN